MGGIAKFGNAYAVRLPLVPNRLKVCFLNWYLDLVKHTSQFRLGEASTLSAQIGNGMSVILAIWHREALLHLLFPHPHKISVLGDFSPASDFLADVIKKRKTVLFRPTGKHVMRPLIDISRMLSNNPGSVCVIAVDGPSGPSGVTKKGAVMLAKLSDVPIIPLHCEARKSWTIATWDRLIFPAIFGEYAYQIGNPISIVNCADSSTIEAKTLVLQSQLEQLSNESVQG